MMAKFTPNQILQAQAEVDFFYRYNASYSVMFCVHVMVGF